MLLKKIINRFFRAFLSLSYRMNRIRKAADKAIRTNLQTLERIRAENELMKIEAWESMIRGKVIVDAMYDNPNYWFRFIFFKKALGIQGEQLIGIRGPFRREENRKTLKRLGSFQCHDLWEMADDPDLKSIRGLVDSLKTEDDFLSWKLPHEFPPELFYDAVLKRQRMASVQVNDSEIFDDLVSLFNNLSGASKVLEHYKPELVCMSHVVSHRNGALAWVALRKGIPVVLLSGNYGVPRFVKMDSPEDIYNATRLPGREVFERYPQDVRSSLRASASEYLNARLTGTTNDIGGSFAYQKNLIRADRESLIKEFGWDVSKPIIGVYASSWFDYPHTYGLSNFRDFLDWIQCTINVAREVKHANWLFKPHPCEEWYGGVTLRDLVEDQEGSHIRITPRGLNGVSAQNICDALISLHGTAGLEYACMGKPVLLADRGWYDHAGVACVASSRENYLMLLREKWWVRIDSDQVKARALESASVHFGYPGWQKNLLLPDDSVQWGLYGVQRSLVKRFPEEVGKEIRVIRKWFQSDEKYLHNYKFFHALDDSLGISRSKTVKV